MNKKIQEILETNCGYGTQALMCTEDIEKFAKAIIDECVNLFGVTENESMIAGYARAAATITIKTHFKD